LGFRVWFSGFRVWGLSRVQGSGFGVWGLRRTARLHDGGCRVILLRPLPRRLLQAMIRQLLLLLLLLLRPLPRRLLQAMIKLLLLLLLLLLRPLPRRLPHLALGAHGLCHCAGYLMVRSISLTAASQMLQLASREPARGSFPPAAASGPCFELDQMACGPLPA